LANLCTGLQYKNVKDIKMVVTWSCSGDVGYTGTWRRCRSISTIILQIHTTIQWKLAVTKPCNHCGNSSCSHSPH